MSDLMIKKHKFFRITNVPLPTLVPAHTCVYQGVRNFSFLEKIFVLTK